MNRHFSCTRAIVIGILIFIPAIDIEAQTMGARTEIVRDEVNKKKGEVEAFDPETSEKFVEPGFKDWVTISVSKKARADYYRGDSWDPAQARLLDPVLDSLGEAVSRKLGLFKPSSKYFAFHSPAEEKMLLGQLKPSTSRKLLRSGFSQSTWDIYKNYLGIPSYRFKRGYVLAKDSADDHPYCKLYYITIVQDYAGGGRYGASRPNYEDTTLTGCP